MNFPRKFSGACLGSCCSLTPSGEERHTSASAPAIGFPFWSLTWQLTNSAEPGVGERTIEPPFSVRGEFMRQNGPSKLAVVSVCPLLPLLRRQISVENPSDPDISTTSLCLSSVFCPSRTTY